MDPVQASPPGQPMLEQQAEEYDHQPAEVCHAKSRKQPEEEEEDPHQKMAEEGGFEGVVGAPADDEGVETVFAVEFVILQGIDHVETDQPEDHGGGEDGGEDGSI